MSGDVALEVLRRLIDEAPAELSRSVAEAVLRLQLADSDRAKMSELACKSNQGTLTPQEGEAYDAYIAVADLLSLWKSKARLALKHHPSAA